MLLASGRDGQPDTSVGPWFLVLAVTSLLVILAAAPEVYDQALRLPSGNHKKVEVAFLVALVGLITLLGDCCFVSDSSVTW
jgi:hypothetical protein